MSRLDDLMGRRAALVAEARAILDAAEAEKRELSVEENEKYDRIMTDVDAVRAQVDREVELRAQEKAIAEAASGKPARTEASFDSKLRAMRPGEGMELRFGSFELRDQTKGTATSGGHTVPEDFVRSLYEHLIEASTLRAEADPTVIVTSSGVDIDLPKTTAHGSAALFAEAAQITTSDSTFGQITMKAWKYGRIVLVSRELVEDTAVDLLGYLARDLGRAIGEASGTHFVTGDNTSKPQGIMAGATVGVTASTSNAVTTDELIDLYHSVVTGHRRGVWLMRDATAAHIRKKKDTTNQYLWQPGLAAGQPDLLLGRPVVTDPNVAALATGARVVGFGDVASAYVIRDVGSVRVERSDEFKFDTDMVAFKGTFRTDGRTRDANAFKVLITS